MAENIPPSSSPPIETKKLPTAQGTTNHQNHQVRRRKRSKESEGTETDDYFGASVTAAAGAATITAGAVEVGVGLTSFSSHLTG